jgi:hypothetical protein
MLQVGEFAPPFQFSPVFGLGIDSDRLSRALVVVFQRGLAARRLAPLVALWPDLDRQGHGLVVLTDVTLTKARDVVPRQHLRFPVVIDPQRFDAWGVQGRRWMSPSVAFVLGPDRRVLYRGPVSSEALLQAVRGPESSSS